MEPLTCCFTGHRPQGLPWGEDETDSRCLNLMAVLAQELEDAWKEGYRNFWCGMARGGDLLFAEAVLACQMVHPEVELWAAIPCPNQIKDWPRQDIDRYWTILKYIGGHHCKLISSYWTRDCMLRRNDFMVERSQRIIALYNGARRGGTFYTLNKARHRGLESVIITPEPLRVVRRPGRL